MGLICSECKALRSRPTDAGLPRSPKGGLRTGLISGDCKELRSTKGPCTRVCLVMKCIAFGSRPTHKGRPHEAAAFWRPHAQKSSAGTNNTLVVCDRRSQIAAIRFANADRRGPFARNGWGTATDRNYDRNARSQIAGLLAPRRPIACPIASPDRSPLGRLRPDVTHTHGDGNRPTGRGFRSQSDRSQIASDRLRLRSRRRRPVSFFEPDPFPGTKRAEEAPFEAPSAAFSVILRAGSVSGHETGQVCNPRALFTDRKGGSQPQIARSENQIARSQIADRSDRSDQEPLRRSRRSKKQQRSQKSGTA